MDVAVTELRAHLSGWLGRARDGEDIVVTDRGVPVARLVGIGTASKLEQLLNDGIIARPALHARPRASGRARPRPRRGVADLVSDGRR
jgi:prevent-host-death family protein